MSKPKIMESMTNLKIQISNSNNIDYAKKYKLI